MNRPSSNKINVRFNVYLKCRAGTMFDTDKTMMMYINEIVCPHEPYSFNAAFEKYTFCSPKFRLTGDNGVPIEILSGRQNIYDYVVRYSEYSKLIDGYVFGLTVEPRDVEDPSTRKPYSM